jgi:ferredoxin
MQGWSRLITVNRYVCGYCGACVGVCPVCALELVEAWLEVSDGCIECGRCVKLCPTGALSLEEAQG